MVHVLRDTQVPNVFDVSPIPPVEIVLIMDDYRLPRLYRLRLWMEVLVTLGTPGSLSTHQLSRNMEGANMSLHHVLRPHLPFESPFVAYFLTSIPVCHPCPKLLAEIRRGRVGSHTSRARSLERNVNETKPCALPRVYMPSINLRCNGDLVRLQRPPNQNVLKG